MRSPRAISARHVEAKSVKHDACSALSDVQYLITSRSNELALPSLSFRRYGPTRVIIFDRPNSSSSRSLSRKISVITSARRILAGTVDAGIAIIPSNFSNERGSSSTFPIGKQRNGSSACNWLTLSPAAPLVPAVGKYCFFRTVLHTLHETM